jgi:putative PIN family toxin of toxin-antitoxin system
LEMNYMPRRRKARVFVDANTIISGLFFKGPENDLLVLGALGSVELITCTFVIEEVREVVRRKFPHGYSKLDVALSALTVLETEYDPCVKELIRDKRDMPILATALKYKPDCLVTGDSDFHTPEIRALINVLKVREFLRGA